MTAADVTAFVLAACPGRAVGSAKLIWIGSVVVAAYTIAGGMLAAVWTDLVQGLLMIVMSVGLFGLAVSRAGGWGTMLDTMWEHDPSLLFAVGTKPLTFIVGFAIMILFGAAGQPRLLTKFLILKNENELRWGAAVAGIAYAVTTLFSLGVGLSMRAMTIGGEAEELANIDNNATHFLATMTHPVVGGLALTALLAAIMSSASSFITIGASSLTRDLVGGLGITVRRELLWGRVASGAVVLAALLFALYLSELIFLLGAIGWAAFGAAIFGPLALGLYWKRATATATIWTIVVALGSNLLITVLSNQGWVALPGYFYLGGVSIVASTLVFIGISYLTGTPSDARRLEELYGEPHSAAAEPTPRL
ncbi:sodium:solute symporter family transporter [Pseudonocardia nigra]|uniref:sodium:solute symporter family transporter n=1 Tax=Pseudonocardia nigra TaxID=1921578 RepID=UPI001C5F2ABD|nr:hypothetical protein [Pseudonocardia nigra]